MKNGPVTPYGYQVSTLQTNGTHKDHVKEKLLIGSEYSTTTLEQRVKSIWREMPVSVTELCAFACFLRNLFLAH